MNCSVSLRGDDGKGIFDPILIEERRATTTPYISLISSLLHVRREIYSSCNQKGIIFRMLYPAMKYIFHQSTLDQNLYSICSASKQLKDIRLKVEVKCGSTSPVVSLSGFAGTWRKCIIHICAKLTVLMYSNSI